MKNSECWYKDVCDVPCYESCIRFLEMKFLMDNSNIPKARQSPVLLYPSDCDLDAFRRLADIKDNINKFVKEGKCVYITSSTTGNGKTTWAIKLLMKYFDTVWAGNGFRVRGLFIHTPTYLLKCKEFGKTDQKFEQLKGCIDTVDVVVWDDIASNELSAYDCGQILMRLDARKSDALSNIYTGNLTSIDAVQRALGAKLSSRIFSTDTEVITFNGADRR